MARLLRPKVLAALKVLVDLHPGFFRRGAVDDQRHSDICIDPRLGVSFPNWFTYGGEAATGLIVMLDVELPAAVVLE